METKPTYYRVDGFAQRGFFDHVSEALRGEKTLITPYGKHREIHCLCNAEVLISGSKLDNYFFSAFGTGENVRNAEEKIKSICNGAELIEVGLESEASRT